MTSQAIRHAHFLGISATAVGVMTAAMRGAALVEKMQKGTGAPYRVPQ